MTNQDSPNTAGAAEPTLPAPDELAKRIIDRSIARLRELHDYAGRPAWDKIVAEEIASALSAFPADLPPQRPSVVPDDIEVLLSAVEKGELTNVDRHLNARMCCDGHMCGCRGSTVGEYLAYELRTALTAAIPAIKAQVLAEIVAWLRMGEHVHSRSGSIESERVFKLIADALERRDHETTA